MTKTELNKMTTTQLISKYHITLTADGKGIEVIFEKKPNKVEMDTLRERKDEIKAYIKAKKEEKERAYRERQAKINAIEGLNEIEKAISEHENYRWAFNRAMENENCVSYPTAPQSNIQELKAKYPRAAAYLKAISYSNASNIDKSIAGNKAVERIINGEDFEQVITEMEKEWSDYCNAHIWD